MFDLLSAFALGMIVLYTTQRVYRARHLRRLERAITVPIPKTRSLPEIERRPLCDISFGWGCSSHLAQR